MAHYGTLHNFRFSNEADDIRGATLYDAQDQKLGTITDLIFEHESGNVRYAIVDGDSWSPGRPFLVPVRSIVSRDEEQDEYRADLTREQIGRLPAYEERYLANDKTWGDYEEKYRGALEAASAALAETGEPSIQQLPPDAGDELWTIEGDSRFNAQDILMIESDAEGPGRQTVTGRRSEGGQSGFPGARIGRRWSRFEDQVRNELDGITNNCTTCDDIRRGRSKKAA